MITENQILVLNGGSSSLKFEVFNIESANNKLKSNPKLKSICKGICDAIGLKNSCFKININDTNTEEDIYIRNHHEAIQTTLEKLKQFDVIGDGSIKIIGHRVVHGGEKYTQATLINKKVIKEIDQLSELAPLHNPVNLAGIKACIKLLPKAKQVAVFDTAFYHSMPEKAWRYAIPHKIYKQFGIRRYGFHGTSHKFVGDAAAKFLRKSNAKLITVHLGNGCSISAAVGGRAQETSMGFTPLEGVVMGTRSGSIDPSIPLFLQEKLLLLPNQVEKILNKESGLLALSELSSDMRTIYAATKKKDKNSILAIQIFSYQIAKTIASYCTVTGTPNAIVFTASIGENAHYVRAQVCEYLEFLGLKLDKKKNLAPHTKDNLNRIISTSNSKVKVLVIATNENLQIAEESVKNIHAS